jgi:hypothetical protein
MAMTCQQDNATRAERAIERLDDRATPEAATGVGGVSTVTGKGNGKAMPKDESAADIQPPPAATPET